MHTTGSRLITNQYRDGKLLQTAVRADFYQFNNQISTPVNYTIKKGDSMETYCVYDTTKRTKETMFGHGSNDEMCMDFLFYYPKAVDSKGEEIFACGGVTLFNGAAKGTICGSNFNAGESNPTV
jgi:hypothetical protein